MEAAKYLIPSVNVGLLRARLDKLNKRAMKLGFDPIMYQILGVKIVERAHKPVEHTEILIEGSAPVIKGWVFAGTVEYLESGGEVFRAINPNVACPTHIRGAKPFCEHCNTHKVKRHSVLLQNVESGEFKNVGKTCLKDFLGDDIEGHVARFSYLSDIHSDLSDPDSEYNDHSGSPDMYTAKEILDLSAHFCLLDGFKPSSCGEDSTKLAVQLALMEYDKPSLEAVELADKVLGWIESDTSDSDFMVNVRNLINNEYVKLNAIGYLAGAVGAYLKNQKKVYSIRNEYFGVEKKRYDLTLTLVKKTHFDTQYGTTWVHTFIDQDNRCFVWFGSTNLKHNPVDGEFTGKKVEVDETVKVKGTIKGFKEYNGVKQTILTRVAIAK